MHHRSGAPQTGTNVFPLPHTRAGALCRIPKFGAYSAATCYAARQEPPAKLCWRRKPAIGGRCILHGYAPRPSYVYQAGEVHAPVAASTSKPPSHMCFEWVSLIQRLEPAVTRMPECILLNNFILHAHNSTKSLNLRTGGVPKQIVGLLKCTTTGPGRQTANVPSSPAKMCVAEDLAQEEL